MGFAELILCTDYTLHFLQTINGNSEPLELSLLNLHLTLAQDLSNPYSSKGVPWSQGDLEGQNLKE